MTCIESRDVLSTHWSDNKDYSLPGYDEVQSVTNLPIFLRNLQLRFSVTILRQRNFIYTSVHFYQTALRRIPEDNLHEFLHFVDRAAQYNDGLFYQFYAQILYFNTFYYIPLRVSSTIMLIFRRSNCISTASGIVTLFRWLFSTQVRRVLP